MTGPFPFDLVELNHPDARIERLFRKSFHAAAPDMPRHFLAVRAGCAQREAGYVHYIDYQSGLFLLGGLCVDATVYRSLLPPERQQVGANGSLARWLMRTSIDALGRKRAVFGYTGDVRSRRDIVALGFVIAVAPYLFVQWHEEPEATRAQVIRDVAALGPF